MNLQQGEFVLFVYACVFGIAIVAGGIAVASLFRTDSARAVEALKAFYDGGNGLRIVTVLTVLATVGVLAFADKLSPGVLSLLSGVAGFVLGGLTPPRKRPSQGQREDKAD